MTAKAFDVATFGETLIRLSTTIGDRLEQASALAVGIGGAESNLASALTRLGRRVAWSSALPRNPLGEKIAGELRRHGVDTRYVHRVDDGRVGVYFLDTGTPPRPTRVLYDRAGSAIALIDPEVIDLSLAASARLLHLTGITPALSQTCAEICGRLAARAIEAGTPISFDINYRSLLWKPDEAARILEPFCTAATILICGRDDAEILWSLKGSHEDVLRGLAIRFGAAVTVLTLGDEGAMALTQHDELLVEPSIAASIVDRVGAGDAFAAGFLHGYLDGDVGRALSFGVRMAALKMTIAGDIALINQHELDQSMNLSSQTIVR